LGEASDFLAQRQIVHAVIDFDALGLAHLPSAARSDGVMYENLLSVCTNFSSLGVQRLLLARAIEDAARLRLCRDIIAAPKRCLLSSHCEYRDDEATGKVA
jgi:hypothetical protein